MVSLLDMLKRYAFSFYEVVVRLEQPRATARMIASYGSLMNKVEREDLSAALRDMRKECGLLHSAIPLIRLTSLRQKFSEKVRNIHTPMP